MDIDSLIKTLQSSGLIAGDGYHNSVTTVFANGAFLAPFGDSDLSKGIEQGSARVTQSLVSGILRAQNFYVFIDTTLQESECGITGSRFIDGKCMIISKRGEGYPDTEPVSKDILLRLDDPESGYNIDATELYRNAYECNGGRLDTTLSFGGGLPKCFYSLPIVSVDGPDICDVIPDDLASAPGYPAGLKLTAYDCALASM